MAKLLSLFVLGSLQIASLQPYPNPHALAPQKSRHEVSYPSHSCACHCTTDTGSIRIRQQKDGPADQFAVKAICRWVYAREKFISDNLANSTGPTKFARTDLLILLGSNAEGIWALEVSVTDAGDETYADLVCTTNEGKRKKLPVLRGWPYSQIFGSVRSSLASRVTRRLGQLAMSGRWNPDSLVPVQRPLLSKAPALIFRPKHHKSGDWSWTLSARAKDGRLVRIRIHPAAPTVDFFYGARWFGGVEDDAHGETWWVLIKTGQVENCLAEWHSIRLTQP